MNHAARVEIFLGLTIYYALLSHCAVNGIQVGPAFSQLRNLQDNIMALGRGYLHYKRILCLPKTFRIVGQKQVKWERNVIASDKCSEANTLGTLKVSCLHVVAQRSRLLWSHGTPISTHAPVSSVTKKSGTEDHMSALQCVSPGVPCYLKLPSIGNIIHKILSNCKERW